MQKLSIENLDCEEKKVLLRVDFNVPLTKEGTIRDDARIQAALPTILYLLERKATLILVSHLGRPKHIDPKLSLAPCAKRLSKLLGKPVQFIEESIGPAVEKAVKELKPSDILMLENIRFHPGEEEPEKEPTLAPSLAKLAQIYVNDAFGAAHRAHTSTSLIAKHFPNKAAMGLLMKKEIEELSKLLDHPEHPFFAIIGGAKISSKAGVLQRLAQMSDALFIGGAMIFPFLQAKQIPIGNSPQDEAEIKTAQELLSQKLPLYLPTDLVIADRIDESAKVEIIETKQGIPPGWYGVDIGPKTLAEWSLRLQSASTIFWNGPVGIFEIPPFSRGTRSLAIFLSQLPADVTIGGGDSLSAVEQAGLKDCFSHLSTGGGASLEFIEYGHLPGIDALSPAP